MGKTALSIGADTFQFFTRNPRGGKAKAVKPEDAAALNALMQEHNFAPILAHAPYTMNPCAADEKLLEFAQMVMEGDLAMLEYVPGNMYNFHPGSHVKQGAEVGIAMGGGMDLAVDSADIVIMKGGLSRIVADGSTGVTARSTGS